MPDPRMAQLGAAIQESAEDLLEGSPAMLVGWCLVAEWMDNAGSRWLSKTSGDADGERLTSWQQRGYFSEALDGSWPDDA